MDKLENDNVISQIVAKLKECDKIEKAVLFGSRARGDNSERSDYDVAVYGDVPFSWQIDLRYYCSETVRTLHKIDLVFVDGKLNPELISNIEREGKVIYEQIRI